MSEEIQEEYQKETVFERAVAAQAKSQKGDAAFNPNEPDHGFLSYDDNKPLSHKPLYALHHALKNHDAAFKKAFVEDEDLEQLHLKPKGIPADKGWDSGRIVYEADRAGKPIEGHLHPIHKAKKDPAAAFEKVPIGSTTLYDTYTKREHKYPAILSGKKKAE